MTKNENILLAILASVIEMSDHAEKMGGATSISGVAALNTLQKSIQKNKGRIQDLVKI